MGWFSINWRLLWPKAHYFLYFAGMASFWPSITVFAKQLGVSEIAVGLLFTLAPITGLISMPLFGVIADRYKIKKKLFLVFNLIMFISLMSFAFLPASIPSRPVSLECSEGASYIRQNDSIESHNEKCNKSDIDSFRKISLLETCILDCKTSEMEMKTFCDQFMGSSLPYFCTESFRREDNASLVDIAMDVRLKINEAMIVEQVLYMPIDIVTDDNEVNGIGYSCISKSIIGDCRIDCVGNHALNLRLQKLSNNPGVYTSAVFWSYVILVLVSWIAFAVVTSVADALCFQTLGDKPHLFGIQRQWGAIGWGLFSLLSGYLIDINSKGSLLKDYSTSFYLVFVMLTLNFFVCYTWDVKEEEKPKALGRSMLELLINPKITIFILACIVVGICTGLQWQFLFWYVEDIASCDDMEWIKVLQGLINIVQCFGGELPFFYISSWFIKTFGHVHCMSIVLGTFGIRFLIYSFLTNPWTILPVELLQGMTYGIFYSNMASYAYVVSPPGSAATVQGIVGAAFEGIGVGAGSLLGGVLYKSISGRLAFRTFGICTLLFCGAHFTSMAFLNKRFTPVSQTDDYAKEGHAKEAEMTDMVGKKFHVDEDSDY